MNPFVEILIAILFGVFAGTFTGLAPGIHINLVSAMLVASISFFAGVPAIALAIFISSMAITHTFIDFIPSIYLGAPEEDTFLSVLPGHELLKLGRAHEAIILTLYGSLAGLLASLILIFPLTYFLPVIENKITLILPFFLIFISCYMILKENHFQKILGASIVFILAGFLGFATFNLPVKEPLLPLLTGLFGASALLTSINSPIEIKKQEITPLRKIRLEKNEIRRSFFSLFFIVPFFSFLPALGSGYAALTSSEFFNHSRRGFLFISGAINTMIMVLSFGVIYSIGKARTGAAASVNEIIKGISTTDLILILLSALVAGIISFPLAINLSKWCAKNIGKISYKTLSIFVLLFLFLIILLFSNLLGLMVFLTSTFLGIFAILSGSKRIHLMGSLLIPTIIYYFL